MSDLKAVGTLSMAGLAASETGADKRRSRPLPRPMRTAPTARRRWAASFARPAASIVLCVFIVVVLMMSVR